MPTWVTLFQYSLKSYERHVTVWKKLKPLNCKEWHTVCFLLFYKKNGGLIGIINCGHNEQYKTIHVATD